MRPLRGTTIVPNSRPSDHGAAGPSLRGWLHRSPHNLSRLPTDMSTDLLIQAVERYIHATASPSTTPGELAALVHPDVQVTIHPNITAPIGTRSALPEMQAGLKAGQSLMA